MPVFTNNWGAGNFVKQTAPWEGSTYTYKFETDDAGWPFGDIGNLELKEDGTATFAWNQAGPLSAGSMTGTWTIDGTTITVTLA